MMHRAGQVLQGLDSLRQDEILCDVELEAEGKTLVAHRAVLAAASPYFKVMFSGRFKETKSQVVAIKGVTFVGLTNIIDCIYTTESKMTEDIIGDIVAAADLLQMTDIFEECKNWMEDKLTESNCFTFLQLAEKYNMEQFEASINSFALENFSAISNMEAFSKISQPALIKYLSSDTLRIETGELSVYEAAKFWISENKVSDGKEIANIMSHVRFALIPPETLFSPVSCDAVIDYNWFTFLQAEKYNMKQLEFSIGSFVLKNFIAVSKTEAFSGISKQALIKFLSSDTMNSDLCELAVYDAAKDWLMKNNVRDSKDIFDIMSHVRFALIPPETLCTRVSHDEIIDKYKACRRMLEEAMNYHSNTNTQPFYEGTLNTPRGAVGICIVPNGDQSSGYCTRPGELELQFLPLSLAAKDQPKTSPSCKYNIVYESMTSVTVNNFLFLFGSECQKFQNFSMRYNASTDTWIELEPAPREATVGSVCALAGDKIFLIGGMLVTEETPFSFNAEKCTDNVFVFDIKTNCWSVLESLPYKSMHSAAAELNGSIYVTGGYGHDEESLDLVVAYNTRTRSKLWQTKEPMYGYRMCHMLEPFEGKLYAIGGESYDPYQGETRPIRSVEVYEPSSNQWTYLDLRGQPSICNASSFVFNAQIYLIGGEAWFWEHGNHIFNIKDGKVRKTSYEPLSICNINCSAALIIPKLL